jgi:hypothetical protein
LLQRNTFIAPETSRIYRLVVFASGLGVVVLWKALQGLIG